MLGLSILRGLKRGVEGRLIDYVNLASPDEQIRTDLQTCIDARGIIDREQSLIQRAIELEPNPTRRKLLEWERDYVALYINRAARVAEERKEHMLGLDTAVAREEELQRCATDLLHWFDYWAWSLDPRVPALPVVPFYPFSFQRDTILWIDELVKVRRSDGVVDKSRDQGVSWIACAYCVHEWRFIPFFQALFGSYKEDLVDSQKKPETLLEKVRFQLRRLPTWMLPQGFSIKDHVGYMKIENPENGALITGAPPVVNFARAARYSLIILDEFPAWPHGGYPQWSACSQSSKSKIGLWTPKGKANKAAELRFSGTVPVKSLHWGEHPWKDDRWYEGQSLSMDSVEKAQELDIDYEASQPGKIFPMWHEAYHVITWSEFEAVYGVRHIPVRWLLSRAQDVGTSEGHENVTAWCARPTKADKWNDSIFFYRYFEAPTHWSIGQIAEGEFDKKTGALLNPGIWQREKTLKEADRMAFSLISWEAKSERRTYAEDCYRYPIDFQCIKEPGPNEGQSEMRNLMQLIAEPHPFARDPETHEPLMGRPRLYVIVDDDEGQLIRVSQDEGGLARSLATENSEGGGWLPRYEIPLYHNPPNEKGKPVKLRKPLKKDDNWIDDARYICRVWGAPSAEKTRAQQVEDKLPEQLKGVNLPSVEWRENNPEDWAQLAAARARVQRSVEKELETEGGGHWKEKGKQRSPRWSKQKPRRH